MWNNAPAIILFQLSADDEVQREAYYREKCLHDEATALGSARREGVLDTLASLVEDGILTIDDATKRANMTVSEFEGKTGLKR